jgi:hypothetical protein
MWKLTSSILLVLWPLWSFGASTFYVSKTLGSDSNTTTQAKSKATPWAHLPGTAAAGCTTGCSNNSFGCAPACKSPQGYTPVAGDQFILYGGDTWGSSESFEWDGNGGSQCVTTPNGSCDYIGVDQTWFNSGVCGASWCRPIFNYGGSVVSNAVAYIFGQNTTIDNIEFTGLATSGGTTNHYIYVGAGGGGNTVENVYLHNWSHQPSGDADNSSAIACSGTNTVIHDSVIDGSDEAGGPDMMTAVDGCTVQYNIVAKNITSGFLGSGDVYHDLVIGPVLLGYTGGHRNGIQNAGANTYSYIIAYDILLTQVQNGGMGQFWFEQGSGNNGIPMYGFNLFEYNTVSGNNFDLCQNGTGCGPFTIFNSTLNCGTASNCFGQSTGAGGTVNLFNNHCVNNAGSVSCTAGGTSPLDFIETDDLAQTTTQADSNTTPHFDKYTGSQTYVFSPVASTNSTVGAGTNMTSTCNTIAALGSVYATAAGAACKEDTTYAVTYDTANHTVIYPARTPNNRPATGAWDIGAYEFVPVGPFGAAPTPWFLN